MNISNVVNIVYYCETLRRPGWIFCKFCQIPPSSSPSPFPATLSAFHRSENQMSGQAKTFVGSFCDLTKKMILMLNFDAWSSAEKVVLFTCHLFFFDAVITKHRQAILYFRIFLSFLLSYFPGENIFARPNYSNTTAKCQMSSTSSETVSNVQFEQFKQFKVLVPQLLQMRNSTG